MNCFLNNYAVLLLFGLTFAKDSRCPYPSYDITYISSATDCMKYYECFDGDSFEMTCDDGFYWNDELKACYNSENVDCNPSIDKPTTPNIGTTKDPRCPYPSSGTIYIADPTDCSKFVKCIDDNAYELSCDNGFYWNDVIKTCDDPSNVNCGSTVTPKQSTITTTTSGETGATKNPRCPYSSPYITYLPDPKDCSKYIECFYGDAFEMTCDSGSYWNSDSNKCDKPENVICNGSTLSPKPTTPHVTKTTEGAVTKDPRCPYPSSYITYLPHPSDCSKYIECFEGDAFEMTCDSGFYWNSDTNKCDKPENVLCNGSTLSPKPTTPHVTKTTEGAVTKDPRCPYPSSDITYLPHPSNCSKYIECFEGDAFEMTCDSGFYWNSDTNKCDKPDNVLCNGSTLSPKPTTPHVTKTTEGAVTKDPRCPYPSSYITYLPHPSDCSKYIECFEGDAFEMTCDSGFYWNSDTNKCDKPENVLCNGSTFSMIPTKPTVTQPYTTTAKTTTASSNKCSGLPDGILLEDPTDCHKYIECIGKKEIERSCPNGTIWIESELTCGYGTCSE